MKRDDEDAAIAAAEKAISDQGGPHDEFCPTAEIETLIRALRERQAVTGRTSIDGPEAPE